MEKRDICNASKCHKYPNIQCGRGITMLTQCKSNSCLALGYKYYGGFCTPQNNIMAYSCFNVFVLEVFIR